MEEWGLPRLDRWRVFNAGVGGLTTGQIRLRAVHVFGAIRPDVVVLESGINDLKFLGLRPDLASEIVSLAFSNTVATVKESVRHGCKVLVLTTWPAGRPSLARRLVWSREIAPAVDHYNSLLRTLANPSTGVFVVDLLQRAGLEPGPALYRDTLHLNAATYARLTPVLAAETDKVLSAPAR
jgi:lysophospholipase L1-like esterase